MKFAAYQFAVSKDIQHNFCEIKKAIHYARKQNAELIVFPECCLTGYPPRDILKSSLVDFEMVDKLCLQLQKLSDKQNISFIIGTIFRENSQFFNRAILFQPGIQQEYYDKKALWGWDKDNFTPGKHAGIFHIGDITVGIRICFEVRFPEYFRELYLNRTDINIVPFYDVSDCDDIGRYEMIRGHLQTRAVENVSPVISVNTISPFQTAPTAVFGKSGQIFAECVRNRPGLIVFDFVKEADSFGERGRREISDMLTNIP